MKDILIPGWPSWKQVFRYWRLNSDSIDQRNLFYHKIHMWGSWWDQPDLLPFIKFHAFFETDRETVQWAKEDARTVGREQLFENCPQQYVTLMEMIDGLRFDEKPPYEEICNILNKVSTVFQRAHSKVSLYSILLAHNIS